MGGALSRFKVLDLTKVRTGPTCVRILADWGADVIAVEQPSDEDDSGFGGRHDFDFQNLHRNKRSMTLNLKSPEGLAVLKRMVETADVLVENYRPNVKYRLGIDYESLRKINPRLVYASISGFGQSGPYEDRPGYDPIIQGMGGLMSVTGTEESGPMRAGIAVSDIGAGIFAATGILVALLEREESGEGQWVDTTLLGTQIMMLDFQASRWLMNKQVAKPLGNNHPTGVPASTYKTRDGHINITAPSQVMFTRLCKALDCTELLTDPLYSTPKARQANRALVNSTIEKFTVERDSADWIERLNAQSVPCGPIYSIDQVFADPQVKMLKMAAPVNHPKLGPIELVATPVNMSRTPPSVRTATPELGEHTDAVLAEYGYSADEIAGLKAGKAI